MGAHPDAAAALQPIQVDPGQIRRAQLAVARLASDAEDCAYLLDVLGLDIPDATRVPKGTRWQIPFGRDSWSKTGNPKQ